MVPDRDIARILLSREEIEARVKALAEEVSRAFDGKEMVAVGILTGAFVFLADLLRHLDRDVCVGFLKATSYRDGTRPGELEIRQVGECELAGRDVLVVEDILDTGHSLRLVQDEVRRAGAKTIRTAVLLDKADRREVDVQVDFVGFTVPDEFLVGYGLDYAQRYRNLPYVGVLRRSVYESRA